MKRSELAAALYRIAGVVVSPGSDPTIQWLEEGANDVDGDVDVDATTLAFRVPSVNTLLLISRVDLQASSEPAAPLVPFIPVTLDPEPPKPAPPHLEVDPARLKFDGATGIYIRSKVGPRWGSYDIATLTRESLLVWLQSAPNLAASIVVILLGHPAVDRG